MGKLIVRKELLDSTVGYGYHGSSYSVKLKDATPEQLKHLAELGVDVFEKPEAEKPKG